MAFTKEQLNFIGTVKSNLPAGMSAWLVGGALRDMLLVRPSHDMDFVLPGDTHHVARAVAHELGGQVFILDKTRDTLRVILPGEAGNDYYLDFILRNGKTIQEDLAARDFTINAMAIELTDLEHLIDPLGGLADLHEKRLKACGPNAMSDDPVRCIRGLRLVNSLDFQLDKATISFIKEALPKIEHSAPERTRDELFQILADRRADRAMRVLDTLGGIDHLFPELLELKRTQQTAPHQLNAWEHSLATLSALEDVFAILTHAPEPEGKGNWLMSMISMHLGRYREQIGRYLERRLTPPRNQRGLLVLAGLYHDAGKPETLTTGEDDRVHFYRHEKAGTPLVVNRAVKLALSRVEVDWLGCVVRQHMRIHHLASQPEEVTPRAAYRFFKATGETGVAGCLLSLADLLATYGTTITREVLEKELVVCRWMLSAWWERPNDILDQPVLLDGNDLVKALRIVPGPVVGELLESIRLGQVESRVKTRAEALKLARALLAEKQNYNQPKS